MEPPTFSPDEAKMLEIEQARIHHDSRRALQARLLEASNSFAQQATSAALTLNGGAVVTFVAFATWASETGIIHARDVMPAGMTLTAGALLAALGSGFAYLAAAREHDAAGAVDLDFEHPHVHDKPEADMARQRAGWWRGVAIAAVLASYLAFAGGIYLVAQAATS